MSALPGQQCADLPQACLVGRWQLSIPWPGHLFLVHDSLRTCFFHTEMKQYTMIKTPYQNFEVFVKVRSYIAQYPVLGTVKSSLHPLADLFIPTLSRLFWGAFSQSAITAQKLFVHISTSVCSQVLIYTAEWTVCSQVLIYTAEWTVYSQVLIYTAEWTVYSQVLIYTAEWTVCTQVLIYTVEWTEATWSEKNCQSFEMAGRGFKPSRPRH